MSAVTDIRSHVPLSLSVARKWKSFKTVLPVGKTSVDQASFYMLSLYRTNLEVRLHTIDESSLQSDSQREIYASVADVLKTPIKASTTTRNHEWDEIYKAESMIALLFTGPQLRQEISARLQDLSGQNLADADVLRRDYEGLLKPPADGQGAGPNDGMLRMFLLRVMEALHWTAKKKYLARPIRIEATNRILIGVLFSFALLVAPYAYLIWDFIAVPDAPAVTSTVSALPATTAGMVLPPELAVASIDGAPSPVVSAGPVQITRAAHDDAKPKRLTPVSKIWSLFALWTALTAGLLGAFFSRLLTIQRQWSTMTLDEVFLHREWPYTLLRAGVGVGGALVVYFFLRSGIAEGALFPKFGDIMIEFVQIPSGIAAVPMSFVMPSKSLALLTFWCFLAGFSEALVPSILSSTERQLSDAASPAQGSRR